MCSLLSSPMLKKYSWDRGKLTECSAAAAASWLDKSFSAARGKWSSSMAALSRLLSLEGPHSPKNKLCQKQLSCFNAACSGAGAGRAYEDDGSCP